MTVTGVDDLNFDGDQSYTISLLPATSDDERYDTISTWVPLSSRLDLPFKTLVHVP